MLISKTVMVRRNGFTSKWYLEKGYPKIKQGDFFECKVEDLPSGSTAKVLVECDYKADRCKGVHEKPYRQYTEDLERGLGNCCTNKKCGALKTKEVLLNEYGVDNIQKVNEYKLKSREKHLRPFSLIVDCANKKDLILLTTEEDYKSANVENYKSRVSFICPKHIEFGEQSTYVEVFLKNKGCCLHGRGELCADASRLDGEIVYQAFIDKGVFPKFKPEEYMKNDQSLAFICPDHIDKGIQLRSYVTLLNSPNKCNYCFRDSQSQSIRTEEKVVFDYFKERDLMIPEGEIYKNKDTLIKYRCNKHPDYIQHTSYAGLKNTKQPCDFCRAEDSLTRLNRRLRSSITDWKKRSELNCNKQCVFTSSKAYDVHHLKPFNEIITEALDFLKYQVKQKYSGEEFIKIKRKIVELHNKYPLGICVSNNIHILFHQLYSKNASIRDWYEFEKRYKLGEFKDILKNVG